MRVMAGGLLAKFRVSFPWISTSCRIHLFSVAMKNHLPDRWTEYSTVGKRIPGTRFIAFKVPLQKLFDNKLTPLQRFSPTNLINEIENQNEELGLVVDLTCTERYYARQELPPTVQYEKIFTAGKQVPSDEVIYKFKRTVKRFLNENSDNDKLVGVHCTHGLNRTGYLVCRYMIDLLGMEPSEAIDMFNKSRGHCIERKNYLDDLLQGKPRSQPCANPSWGHRVSTPQFSQYMPGPQQNFHQMGGRQPSFVNPGPVISPANFPHLRMPVPRYHIPHMEDNQQPHFRGGHPRQRHHPNRHHPNRHFTQQQDNGPVNGAHMWHFAPHIPQNYGGGMVNGTDNRGFSPQLHVRNGPYSRWHGQGHRGTPGRQWQ